MRFFRPFYRLKQQLKGNFPFIEIKINEGWSCNFVKIKMNKLYSYFVEVEDPHLGQGIEVWVSDWKWRSHCNGYGAMVGVCVLLLLQCQDLSLLMLWWKSNRARSAWSLVYPKSTFEGGYASHFLFLFNSFMWHVCLIFQYTLKVIIDSRESQYMMDPSN